MTVITLPRVTAADACHVDAMMAVMHGSFDAQFGEAWSAAQLGGTLALTGSFARQALDENGAILGFSLSRAIAGEAELLLVAVDQSWRRRGIARLLVDKVADDARLQGATTLFLEVRENNDAARNLYRRSGFVDVGRRANYYIGASGNRFAAITMQRRILV